MCGGVQGEELLSALGRFVKDLAIHGRDVDAMEVDEPMVEQGRLKANNSDILMAIHAFR